MSTAHYRFTLSFEVPVAFTTGAFDVANPTFLECVTRLEPDRCHRLLVVVDSGVAESWPSLMSELEAYADTHATAMSLSAPPLVIDGGEASKQGTDVAMRIASAISEYSIDRQSFVIAIGGGAVLDATSFAAAIAHRGVRVIRVPTTTLSQGDSGVAVKNGVNYFGKKNFLGSFAPPFAVINDVALLSTLSARDRRCGLSEAVKVALLRDPEFFDWIESKAAELNAGDQVALAKAVERSAALHANHIYSSGDPFELGSARPMDFGHWVAHKLESLSDHAVKHGEAVAIGMALDVCYAVRLGMLESSVAERVLRVLEALGFTLFHPGLQGKTADGMLELLAGLEEFREHLGGQMHITQLETIGRGVEVHEMQTELVVLALGDLATRAAKTAAASS